MKKLQTALSFDDVLLVPRESKILPSEAEVNTKLTKGISLNIPLISAAMDTVTEEKLAIAIAREGGIGVIHRNCSIKDQTEMVAKVKRSENRIIYEPFVVRPDLSISDLKKFIIKYNVTGFPVVDEGSILLGIVASRDIWLQEDKRALLVRDVMTPLEKLITATTQIKIQEASEILYKNRIEKLPLIDSSGKLVGLITAKDIEQRSKFPNSSKDTKGHLLVGAAIGTDDSCIDRARELIKVGADVICIDAATGHTKKIKEVIETIKSIDEKIQIIAGNVVTADGAEFLIKAGANALKVGVGPGSICTTRIISGVGFPQFTAISDVSKKAQEYNIPVIADGGIRHSGDIVKALAAGASSVMIGSIFASAAESPGEIIQNQGNSFKKYRGMGSLGSMKKGAGDRYNQDTTGKLVPEGIEGRVPYRGKLSDIIYQFIGGLRSGMGYIGAKNIEELKKKAKFVQITHGGFRESHAHDVFITEEPLNYPLDKIS